MPKTDNLLVATSTALVRVSLESGKVDTVHQGDGLYYGVTWDNNCYYVAVRSYHPIIRKRERPAILVFNKNLEYIESLIPEYSAGGIHQILYYEGEIFISCSREDNYLIYDGHQWKQWYPFPIRHNTDVHHFNSIWIDSDELYIVGHNNGPSDIWSFNYPERRVVRRYHVGKLIHNVWKDERGELCFCNSDEGMVETVNGEILCTTNGFTRGVVASEQLNVIGISEFANRRNRKKTKAYINVYDKDWNFLDQLYIGPLGQVCELRSLDSEDFAHNCIVPGFETN